MGMGEGLKSRVGGMGGSGGVGGRRVVVLASIEGDLVG